MSTDEPKLNYSAGRYDEELLSMASLYLRTPIGDHYDHVRQFAEKAGVEEDDEVWRYELVLVSEIDAQVMHDPDDTWGIERVAKFRRLQAAGGELPPVILHHYEGANDGELSLWDGQHRYNAALEDGRLEMSAWVLHYGECSCLRGNDC